MPLAIGMLPFIFGVVAIQLWLQDLPWPSSSAAALLFASSLVGIFLGRSEAGTKGVVLQAVMRDIQLMMIAPVWLLSNLYRRFGIPF